MNKFRVGILGATGTVGQKFVELLDGHPWFEVTALAASKRSAGKTYAEATNWIGSAPIPEVLATQRIVGCSPPLDCDFVFSGLLATVAGPIEKAFAEAGYPVLSNARNHRMDPTVPLLIPEVNPDHTQLITQQAWPNGGFIITNPNCSTVGLVMALKPLMEQFGLEAVQVTTMQALSGAGYPGVPALDILNNVVPFIGGEEEKLATEPLKLLGQYDQGNIVPATIRISAQCNRVPVLDGHLECVSVKCKEPATPKAVKQAFKDYTHPLQDMNLPTSPAHMIQVFEDERFPQPRRHGNLGAGMTVSVGRIRGCSVLDVKFVVLVHNTIRGAAGGAILNAELLVQQGFLKKKEIGRPATSEV